MGRSISAKSTNPKGLYRGLLELIAVLWVGLEIFAACKAAHISRRHVLSNPARALAIDRRRRADGCVG
jgi:hypothetical protein